MPKYYAEKKCYWDNVLHGPGTKRAYVVTQEPIPEDKLPSYLKPVKGPVNKAAERKEKRQVTKRQKKVAADKKEIEAASFLSPNPAGSNVETL